MSKIKFINSIIMELKKRKLISKMRRKNMFKMIIRRRKLLKQKMLLLCSTTMPSTIVQDALSLAIVDQISQFTHVRSLWMKVIIIFIHIYIYT